MVQVDLITVLAVGTIALLIYYYISKKYQYFLSKPIPCLRPTFLLGSTGPMMFRRADFASHIRKLYGAFPESKVIGFYDFTRPIIMLRDPETIKRVVVKDFDYFLDHTPLVPTEQDNRDSFFMNSLFFLRGQKWRDMRSTLSPAFTGAKMRHMFGLVAECGRSMTEFLRHEVAQQDGKRLELEMKDVFSRFGVDCIASVAFGFQVDSLRQPENDFFIKGKAMLDLQSFTAMIHFMMLRLAPGFSRKIGVDFVSSGHAQYFKGIIKDNMKQRQTQNIIRDDMVHMLMEVRKGALKHLKDEQELKDDGFATVEESSVGKQSHSTEWTENELISQCFAFFFAGFDTTSTCLSFLTYELCINPEIQQKLFEEIEETDRQLNGQQLTYEVLQKMIYMDMVVSEVLRKWPPAVVADRYCVKDYTYQDTSGTRFLIEKGRSLWLPIVAIHQDPKYYAEPEKFDPERFNAQNRTRITPGTYLPFGIGPRNCIGSRLALMEVKSIVYYLLKDFSLEPTSKTEIPLTMSKKMFSVLAENGVWLEFKPRRQA
ncbi:cytochrome P450 9e2-like [Uranotaenia lowii]|uniref:cytochrome P450 9e2-like n=1 Tax=Uranotaenia lowii TaxID=190385 RepID=UPI0024785DEB|nr:cytochrome P450 9e2-like [Uranotaenia lowii]